METFDSTHCIEIGVRGGMFNHQCLTNFRLAIYQRNYWIRLVSGREVEWTHVTWVRVGFDWVARGGCVDLNDYRGGIDLPSGEVVCGSKIESFRLLSEKKSWRAFKYCWRRRWWGGVCGWYEEMALVNEESPG